MDSLEEACMDLLGPLSSDYDDYTSVGKQLKSKEPPQVEDREQNLADMNFSFAVRPHTKVTGISNNSSSSTTGTPPHSAHHTLSSVDLAKEPLWYLSLISHNPTLMEAVSHLYVQLWTQYAEQRKSNEVQVSALRAEQEAQLASLLEVAHAANDVVVRSDVTKRLVLRHEHEVDELMERLNGELRRVETDAQQSFCALLKVSAPDALQVASKQLSIATAESIESPVSSSPSPISAAKGKELGSRVTAHEKRVKRLEYLRSLCTPRKLSRTNNMSLFADPQFPPVIYEVSVQNPLREHIPGARAKDPTLAAIALEVAPLWELRRCLHFGDGRGRVSSAWAADGVEGEREEDGAIVESEFDTYMNDFCFEDGSQEASRNYWSGERLPPSSESHPADSRVPPSQHGALVAGLWNTRSTKQQSAAERRKEQLAKEADVAADLTATAVQIHLLRLAHSHHSMLLVVGSEATANSMIEAPDAPEILMSENWESNWTDVGTNSGESAFRPLDSQSQLKVCFTTKLWGANIILLHDPFQYKERTEGGPRSGAAGNTVPSSAVRLPEAVVHDAFRFALSWGVDSFSVAVLPRPTDALSVAQGISVQLLEQLRLAVASTLVDTAGGATVSRSHLWDLNYAALLTHNNLPSASTQSEASSHAAQAGGRGGRLAQNRTANGSETRAEERRSSYMDISGASHEPTLDEQGRYGGYMGRLGRPLTSLLYRMNGSSRSIGTNNNSSSSSSGVVNSNGGGGGGEAVGSSAAEGNVIASTQSKYHHVASPLAVNTGTIEFEGVGVGTFFTHPGEMHNTEKVQFNLPMSIRAYLPLQFPSPNSAERERVSSLSEIGTLQDERSGTSPRNASSRTSARSETMRGAFPSASTLGGDTPRERARSHRHVRMHSIIAVPTITDVLSKAFGSSAVVIQN